MPSSSPAGSADPRPQVAVFTLGGTIGMAPPPTGGDGVCPAFPAADLLKAVPDLGSEAGISLHELMNKPSPHLTFEDLYRLAVRIRRALAAGADGTVVVQGTDTIEVTAFVLDLLLRGSAPVVVTGAMRAARVPGADGPANLTAAIRVAASRSCRDLGTLVVMNDEIHAARSVTKRHSSSPAAFASDPGPIGRIVEGRPQVLSRPDPCRICDFPFDGAPGSPAPRVAHVSAEIGDDGLLIDAALDIGCDGIIVSGMGGGHVPPAVVPSLAAAAARIPVVLASRCPNGGVLAATYGYAGGEIDLARRGVIRAGRLSPSKARAALVLALHRGQAVPRIRSLFRAFGGG